jgi:ABC-type dipeptide/oligopeptide/nickel transport system permease subunit
VRPSRRKLWFALGAACFAVIAAMGLLAPEYVATPDSSRAYLGPAAAPPLGTDERGIPLHQYAMQGAGIVALPSIAGALVVMLAATFAGLVRCADIHWLDTAIQAVGELVGALPRMVVVLVVALMLPYDWRLLLPIALTWGFLASPAAMDEAAASAGRLGGARFVEALRAHGFTATRIYLYHVVWMNLRPVIVRQGAEVGMQVVFLEIALSYLALASREPSFTHPESSYSWATLLYQGYTWMLGQDLFHSMVLGLGLVALTTLCAGAFRLAAGAR